MLKQYPDNIRILNDLAWIIQEQNHQYQEALELANRGLNLAPNNKNLLDTRGTILSNMDGQLSAAKADFEKLIKLPLNDQQKAQKLLKLGRICARLNEHDQAKQYLQQALEIDSKLNVFTPEEKTEINEIINGNAAQH